MSIRYGKFEMPEEITIEQGTATESFARFIAEPYERGNGHTVGNAMRRIMLTSLEAPAIIGMRIEGVPHEFMAIEGVIEDVVNIILNLKNALLRKLPTDAEPDARDQRIMTTLLHITQDQLTKGKGQVKVTLGDLVKEGFFEVVNPELHLFTVTKAMKRQIDLRVAIGRGYVPSERHVIRNRTTDEILIDAAFSPVRQVNYFVENTRVGQDTDYDRLILDVRTDGRVQPEEAVTFAAQIAVKHFEVFQNMAKEGDMLTFEENRVLLDSARDELMEKLALRIDEIELSVRSTNCLSGANIETIAELVMIPERRMLEFKNFGKKSLNEIKAKLSEMSLSLGMDLSTFGLSLENVKEKMTTYHEEQAQKEKARLALRAAHGEVDEVEEEIDEEDEE